jgi:RHS repeat-associated protein
MFHYDIVGKLILETSNTATSKVAYVYANNELIAQVRRSGTTDTLVYVHTDHEGTPRLATNTSAVKVWSWEGRAFGDTTPNQDPDGDGSATTINFRYGNAYRDSESDLWNMGYRVYDPQIGRFITSDPIGLAGGRNTYGYGNQNPLRYTDPRGLNIDVCYYPDGITHVGYGVPGVDQGTFGYYPKTHLPIYPGEVKHDPQDEKRECKTIPSSEDQDKCMLNCRLKKMDNPGIYSVGTNQCTSFVRECMRECGIPTGIERRYDGFQGPRPDRFYESLPGTGVSYPGTPR